MRNAPGLAATAGLVLLCAPGVPGRPLAGPQPAASASSDSLLVAFKERVPHAARLRAATRHGLRVDLKRSSPYFATLRIDAPALAAGMTVESAPDRLRRDPAVRYAEPNHRRRASAVPNDPRFYELWGLHNIGQSSGTEDADVDAPEAWNAATGSSSVVVAVVDTGVDTTHEDLSANILRDARGAVVGYDYANGDSDPMDDEGHGTHVAGTLGARGNNGIGVAGVNWNVRIMPLKFLDAEGSGYDSDAVRSIDFAIANGAHVINASWGGGGFNRTLLEAIQRARDAGILFIAAAGNESSNNDVYPAYPANYNRSSANVVSVAATTRTDALASFSNFGPTSVDIAAPGQGILSTLPGNRYATYSGTSMATPHVAGAYALVRAHSTGLSLTEWKARLLQNNDPLPGLAGRIATGGRLNLHKALGTGTPEPPPPAPTGDSWEVDDSAAQSRTTALGEARGHTFHVAGDVDWVRFTVAAGARVVMTTSNLQGGTDTVLDLFNQSGAARLATDDDGGGGYSSRLAHRFRRGGTYYLRVREYHRSGGPGYGYTLTVR